MSTTTQPPTPKTQAASTPSTTTNPTTSAPAASKDASQPQVEKTGVCICKVPCHCAHATAATTTTTAPEKEVSDATEKQWTYQSVVNGKRCTCKFELKCSQNCPCQQKNASGEGAGTPCGCTTDIWKCNCHGDGSTQCTFHIEKCKCCTITKCGYAFSGQSAPGGGVLSTSGAPMVGGQA